MKKEDLTAMGLTDEQAEKVLAAFDGYAPKEQMEGLNAQLKQIKAVIQERDTQLEALKSGEANVEELKTQIAKIQQENKAKDEAHAKQIREMKIDAAVTKALTNAKARNLKAAKALLDLDSEKIEWEDSGDVKGLTEKIKTLMESEDSKFLFASDTQSNLNSFQPGEKMDAVQSVSSSFENRLAEAYKTGNNLQAIQIKQEAIQQGVALM